MNPSLRYLLQTSDSAFPVGGFAHSYGLEGLVQCGTITTPADLSEYIENSWIPSLTHVDLPLIRLARDNATHNTGLFRIDTLACTCRATSEIRSALRKMGRQRLKLIAHLTNEPRLNELYALTEIESWHAAWPSVWGVESGILDIPLDDVMQAYMHHGLFGLLTAALKLLPIGPTEVQTQLTHFMTMAPSAIEQSYTVDEERIGWFNPVLDIASARHEHAYSRIFIS